MMMTLEQSSAAASTCSGSTRIKTCQCIDSSRSRRRRRRRPAAAGGRKASTSTCAGRFLLHAYAGAAAVAAASTAQSNEYAAATASAGAYLTEEHLRSIQNFDPRRQAAAAAADRRALQQPPTSAANAQCRPLRIDEWLGLLQTEAGAEFDLTEEVAGMAGVDPAILLARAQIMWEDATAFEWARSAGTSASDGDAPSTPAPFVVCHERTAPVGPSSSPVVSGFRRRRRQPGRRRR